MRMAGCGCVPEDFTERGVGVPNGFAGRVGEWLKPADCKSAAPCGLRRFESSPVHQRPHERMSSASGAIRDSGGSRHPRCQTFLVKAARYPLVATRFGGEVARRKNRNEPG